MIARGEASWLLIRNPKTTGLVPFHRAVVIKASKAAVAKAKKQRTQGIRLKKHFGYEANIFCDFRKFIQKHFAAGTLPQTALNISDVDLRAGLRDVEKLYSWCPELGSKKLCAKVAEFSVRFWDNVLAHEGLPENCGLYFKNAARGKGKQFSGQYDLEEIDAYRHVQDGTVADFLEPGEQHEANDPNHGRKVQGANFRKGTGDAFEAVDSEREIIWHPGINPDADGDLDYTADTADQPSAPDKESGNADLDHPIDFREWTSPEKELDSPIVSAEECEDGAEIQEHETNNN
jgi:hypothetical protein